MSGGMDEPYGRKMSDEELEAHYVFSRINPVEALAAVREATSLAEKAANASEGHGPTKFQWGQLTVRLRAAFGEEKR